jgi:peptidoglycan-N-acetylglucosamine deacetylase
MISRLFASAALVLCLAGCANQSPSHVSLRTSFAPAIEQPKPLLASDPVPMEPQNWMGRGKNTQLAGRTLTVSNIHDIKLGPKEVILTFDDGPSLKKTETVLDDLDQYNVKATFMLVGEMAKSHPEIVQDTLRRGHSIGSHTYRHPNLKAMGFDQAMNEIMRGENAVRDAAGVNVVGFFRFPYLADTQRLRHALADRGTVVMDVDVDTKDYYKDTANQVLDRTMEELAKRHGGIILMHDIHTRTVAMLPLLLKRLNAEGYKVVTLRYGKPQHQMLASRL